MKNADKILKLADLFEKKVSQQQTQIGDPTDLLFGGSYQFQEFQKSLGELFYIQGKFTKKGTSNIVIVAMNYLNMLLQEQKQPILVFEGTIRIDVASKSLIIEYPNMIPAEGDWYNKLMNAWKTDFAAYSQNKTDLDTAIANANSVLKNANLSGVNTKKYKMFSFVVE